MTREEQIKDQIRELTLKRLMSSPYAGREKNLQLYYEIGLLTAVLARVSADDSRVMRQVWNILDPD